MATAGVFLPDSFRAERKEFCEFSLYFGDSGAQLQATRGAQRMHLSKFACCNMTYAALIIQFSHCLAPSRPSQAPWEVLFLGWWSFVETAYTRRSPLFLEVSEMWGFRAFGCETACRGVGWSALSTSALCRCAEAPGNPRDPDSKVLES